MEIQKVTMNKLSQILGFKNPQNLYHLEKSGKFNPSKNMTGKVYLTKDFQELYNMGYTPFHWGAYQELKSKVPVNLVKIVDFYGLPVAFVEFKTNNKRSEK